jgi:hypothetical protein
LAMMSAWTLLCVAFQLKREKLDRKFLESLYMLGSNQREGEVLKRYWVACWLIIPILGF